MDKKERSEKLRIRMQEIGATRSKDIAEFIAGHEDYYPPEAVFLADNFLTNLAVLNLLNAACGILDEKGLTQQDGAASALKEKYAQAKQGGGCG